MGYEIFSIISAARRSGLPVDVGGQHKLHINCPFCGDRKRRLYLYTDTNQYHCFHCHMHGNAVDLYAQRTGISYKDAYHALQEDNVIRFPKPVMRRIPEQMLAPIEKRNAVYRAMLEMLPLSDTHCNNLINRGLTEQAIQENGYRTLEFGKDLRDWLAEQLSSRFDLNGIPGFFYVKDAWRMCAYSGMLVPVRAVNGCIQGIQIRRDSTERMKYVWMSSIDKPHGTGARSWVHVVGNRLQKEAIITEGALKGDISSLLMGRSLVVCLPGVDATAFMAETLAALHVQRVWEAFDMDKVHNAQVAASLTRLQRKLEEIGVSYRSMSWSSECKGLDDYLLMKQSA